MRIKITVEKIPEDRLDDQDDGKLALDLSGERDIYAWVATFKLILYFLTFSEDSVKEIFKDEE